MSEFTDFEDFHHVEGTYKTYVLDADLHWHVGKKDSPWVATIEAGTPFDLSVLRCMEWALSPHNRVWLPAAAVHDYFLNEGYDALFAASAFRRAVKARAKKDWRIWPAYFGVVIWTVRPWR